MKRIACILCGIFGLAIVAFHALPYFEGRLNQWLILPGLMPAILLPALIGVISASGLLVTFLVALLRRKDRVSRNDRIVIASMMGLACILLILSFVGAPAPGVLFMSGFRSRIQSTITADELREIAVAAQNVLPQGGQLPGPEKWSLWREEEHRTQWESLTRSTSIENLDQSIIISRTPNSVDLIWGGALVGHWGITMDTGPAQRAGDIAVGIRTVMFPH